MGLVHRRSTGVLLTAVVVTIASIVASLGMFASIAAANHELTVSRAELDRGRLRIEGTTTPNTMVVVDGGAAHGQSDNQGRFKIEAFNFDSPTCVAEVTDGATTVQAELDRCVPTAPPEPEPPAGGVPPPPPAGPFLALEIFDQVPLEVPAPLHPSPQNDASPIPDGVPPTALGLFVAPGAVVLGVNGDQTKWRVQAGDQEFLIYTSADTRIDLGLHQGDVVKVVAVRTLAPGPIVAEVIRLRTTPVDEAGFSFLYNGAVEAVGNEVWTVGGVDFGILNDPANDLVTDFDPPGLGEGDPITVEFVIGPIAP